MGRFQQLDMSDFTSPRGNDQKRGTTINDGASIINDNDTTQ